VDLQGPKLRVGAFTTGRVTLTTGVNLLSTLMAVPEQGAGKSAASRDLPALSPECSSCLTTARSGWKSSLAVRVTQRLEFSWAAHCPTAKESVLSALSCRSQALTPKDRIDLTYGLELGADWIALSFVQRPGGRRGSPQDRRPGARG